MSQNPNRKKKDPSPSSHDLDYLGEVDPNAYMQDLKQKNKLLQKWDQYFPLEPAKPYDVRLLIFTNKFIAKRFQTFSHLYFLRIFRRGKWEQSNNLAWMGEERRQLWINCRPR